jgi:hypothetical protein
VCGYFVCVVVPLKNPKADFFRETATPLTKPRPPLPTLNP